MIETFYKVLKLSNSNDDTYIIKNDCNNIYIIKNFDDNKIEFDFDEEIVQELIIIFKYWLKNKDIPDDYTIEEIIKKKETTWELFQKKNQIEKYTIIAKDEISEIKNKYFILEESHKILIEHQNSLLNLIEKTHNQIKELQNNNNN